VLGVGSVALCGRDGAEVSWIERVLSWRIGWNGSFFVCVLPL